ncbi:BTAD domain-containing putative transcriptional regulator [Dactylosporangium sp. AC04546]|uniref:AfsR/SARP family transcriptional regulator n=1 Tax=Dactylosporangium sp. AC04546 TaxID=2862460 RepID=UPI001EDE7A8F|nr:BTAD domain-containing putative transcriptional regulator [Dactylosporangium sp. AC04546]WVK80990.1 BTAD domain-containing putative transcriptional regulator [Dactylosporangium sp. AC04546]
MARLDFRILGPLEVVRMPGETPLDLGARKQRAVLALLLLEPGRVVSLDRIIHGLWGDEAPVSATGTLQAYISQLRRVLEPDRPPRTPPMLLVTREPGYLLAVHGDQVDAVRFTTGVETARAHLAAGAFAEAEHAVTAALGEWRGAPLADFADEEFATAVAAQLGEHHDAAVEDLVEILLSAGRNAEATTAAQHLLDRQPFRERAWGQLMLALYRSGRQADALAAFRRARSVLDSELGLPPGPQLQALETAILRHDSALDHAPPVRAATAVAEPRRPGGGPAVAGGFGAHLRALREQRALTQEELAERAGLTVNAIGALERGVRRRPYPHTVRALADALGLDDGERAALAAAVPSQARAAPVPTLDEPAERSPLIGRVADVAAVAALLTSRRVVTLTGPGGVGKTRLALAVAAQVAQAFPHGHVIVELAALRDPGQVLESVARRLGIAEQRQPGGSVRNVLTVLTEFLAGRRLLLVLDNLEHLLGCAVDVADLVARCPDLVVLATSRSPLRIRAEHEVVVEPLEVPDAWALDDPDSVERSPAVAMFLDRAAAMGAPVALTRENAATIAAICWRLDGLPLAIELVAARSRLLEPAALLERLDYALSAGAIRDLPDRQQSVQDTVDWSYELLDEAQRRLFTRLAAFSGTFSLEAAEAVGGPEHSAMADLATLVEQSLVVRVPAGQNGQTGQTGPAGQTRFRMLGPIHRYAQRRLAGAPDAELVADRHAEHFRTAASRGRPGLDGAELARRLDALEEDHANLNAAVERLLAAGRDTAAVTMIWDLILYLALRGHAAEGLGWLDRARTAALPAGPRCHALGAAGTLAYVLGDLPRAREDAMAAFELARTLADTQLLTETAAIAGLAAVFVGDVPAAARVVAAAPADGGGWAAALLLGVRAQIAILSGDPATAVRWLGAADATARDSGNPFAVATILNMRATVTEMAGDDRGTARLLAESVTVAVHARIRWPLAYALPALAGVAARTGDAPTAARLFGAAASLTGAPLEAAPADGSPPGSPDGSAAGRVPASRRMAAGDLAAVRDRLGEPAFRAAFDDGRLLGFDQLAGLAERLSRSAAE